MRPRTGDVGNPQPSDGAGWLDFSDGTGCLPALSLRNEFS